MNIFFCIIMSAMSALIWSQDSNDLRTQLIEDAAAVYGTLLSLDDINRDVLETLLRSDIAYLIRTQEIDDVQAQHLDIDDLVAQSEALLIRYRCTNQLNTGGQRIWDLAQSIQDIALTINSKIDAIEIMDIITTITLVNNLANNSFVVMNNTYTIVTDLILIESGIETIISGISLIDQELQIIEIKLQNIEFDEFTGTWTALEAMGKTISSSLDVLIENSKTIESMIDGFEATALDLFITTFSEVEIVLNETTITTTTIAYLSDEVEGNLSGILSQIDNIAAYMMNSVYDNIINLQNIETAGFSGTFTVIEGLRVTLLNTESFLNRVIMTLENSAQEMVTLLAESLALIAITESKMDNINNYVETVIGEASQVDSLF